MNAQLALIALVNDLDVNTPDGYTGKIDEIRKSSVDGRIWARMLDHQRRVHHYPITDFTLGVLSAEPEELLG